MKPFIGIVLGALIGLVVQQVLVWVTKGECAT
ncbi:hypothetical protein HRbin17_00706 [bacterium HR17]|uniref:Uncharacterized protein n=1 Tax=Candidatus Fervidibacter japonicus TaxID=2035412 RepID=A0A2H5XAS7_9BACT|nr:hypothetical protein HRbin17_00706 [bacterium HR17]